MSGMVVSFMGAGSANPAIAYALSNAAPVVAMIWGFFVWKLSLIHISLIPSSIVLIIVQSFNFFAKVVKKSQMKVRFYCFSSFLF